MTRPTLLVAWELGAGRGHLEIMRPIIAAILKDEWNVVAAVRDVARANIVLKAGPGSNQDRLRIMQAPIFVHRAERPPQAPRTLTDIFADIGFRQPSLVQPLLIAWASILKEVRPQVLLADTAPSLLAANQGQIPTVVIGNGWTIPPDIAPTPAFDETGWNRQRTALAEAEILAAIKTSGFRPPRAISQLTHGNATFVFTPKEIDPYGSTREKPVIFPPNVKLNDESKIRHGTDFTIYLPPNHPAIKLVLAEMERTQLHGRAFFGEENAVPKSGKVRVSRRALDLQRCLPSTNFVIHHGGLGMASWCIAYGTPQLIIPLDAEKRCIGKCVDRMGLGRVVEDPRDLRSSICDISARPKSLIYDNENIDSERTISMVLEKVRSFCYDM